MKITTAFPLLALAASALGAQQTARTTAVEYQTAVDAWDKGDYPQALEGLQRVVAARDGGEYLERVALLTGELYATRELTTDGRSVRWSPDGRWAAYEVVAGGATVTRVLEMGGEPKVVATVPGTGLVFSPNGDHAAFVSPRDTGAAREGGVLVRDLRSGQDSRVDDGRIAIASLAWSADGATLYALGAGPANEAGTHVYALAGGAGGQPPTVTPLTAGDTVRNNLQVVPGGRFLIYTMGGANPVRRGAPGRGGMGFRSVMFAVHDLTTKATQVVTGVGPVVSADGSTLAWVGASNGEYTINVSPLPMTGQPTVVKRSPVPLDAPALSPSGQKVAFQMQPWFDWEIVVVGRDGSNEQRVTREIQHDVLPRFLDERRLLAMQGESRHRRSFLYDVSGAAERMRLFHNNTVRTIAPEYEWAPSPDGTRLLVVAERDGNTVTTDRGVYLMELGRKVTAADVRQRLASSLAAERALRAEGERAFRPIADAVRKRVAEVSVPRIYSYEKALFDFDSKHITRPGNAKARQYLLETYRSFGYDAKFQEFETRATATQPAIRTANVMVRLEGTVNPELVYVVGAHFDSRAEGPGADDNTSGTAMIMEAARVLAKHPLPATVVFVSFTGEEAGLLGSREFVRRAIEEKWKVAGALNNDMLGWANDFRLDNTIRYSNPGIRDVQHQAAFLFTDLVTYDALYYKSTDAAAFYDGWGDIVGGIGSYPVLGNPHYHMPHDVLEVENHQLIAETSKTTVATIMLLASSPSRLTGLAVARQDAAGAELTWTPSPEKGVRKYLVRYTAAGGAEKTVTVTEPRVRLPGVGAGATVAVKAVNDQGLEGWDWARMTLGAGRVADR